MKKLFVFPALLLAMLLVSSALGAEPYDSPLLADGWENASVEELRQAEALLSARIAELTCAGQPEKETLVWVSSGGRKYHASSLCSSMKSPRRLSVSDAQSAGYTPCKKCY